jgi:hypothetical protein
VSDNDPSDGLTNYERAHLELLAGIETQLTRLADSANTPPVHVSVEQAVEAWNAELRMHEDKAVPFLRRLGIEVD